MREPLTATQVQMIEELMPFARNLAAKMYVRAGGRVDHQDLRSEAYLGLVHAATTYRADRGKWVTHAFVRIQGQMLDFIRRLDPNPRYASRDGEGVRTVQFGIVKDERGPCLEAVRSRDLTLEEQAIIQDCISFQPSARRRHVLASSLCGDLRFETAAELGVHPSAVNKLIVQSVADYRRGYRLGPKGMRAKGRELAEVQHG